MKHGASQSRPQPAWRNPATPCKAAWQAYPRLSEDGVPGEVADVEATGAGARGKRFPVVDEPRLGAVGNELAERGQVLHEIRVEGPGGLAHSGTNHKLNFCFVPISVQPNDFHTLQPNTTK